MRKPRQLSAEAARVVQLFVDEPESERYGLDIIRLARIPSGSLYPILHRLEERGLLVSSWDDLEVAIAQKRRPRRLYRLEDADRANELLIERARNARPTKPVSGRLRAVEG